MPAADRHSEIHSAEPLSPDVNNTAVEKKKKKKDKKRKDKERNRRSPNGEPMENASPQEGL